MVRKQIVIEAEQERALAGRAATLGISQSAVVREALEAFLGGARSDAHKKRAWDELQAGMSDSVRLRIGSRGRTWTREELHER
jgi:hypothetical protein